MLGRAANLCAKRLVRRNVYHEIFRQNNTKITDQSVPVANLKMANINNGDREEFNSFYPVIVKDLMESVKEMNVPEMTKWYPQMLEYNLLSGKHKRGLSVVITYKLLEDPKKLTKENIRLANILGWCTEMITSFCVIYGDVVDQAEMRCGAPCWYKVENVGVMALTDAIMLENKAYLILSKYFRDHPCYLPVCELFQETVLHRNQGQALDHRSSSKNKQNLQHFTMDRYKNIAMYRTGYFAFCYPVTAAMYLAGIQDAELHCKVASVLHQLGILVQIKNDFLNCFGDVNTNRGTLYRDIRDGKCTWPAVITLQRASPAQRAIMEKCYGRADEQSVQAVMDVYRAVDLPTLFVREEEEIHNKMRNQIEQMDSRFPKKLFYNIFEML